MLVLLFMITDVSKWIALYLQEKSIAGLQVDSLLDTERVGNGQIISNDLEVAGLVEVRPVRLVSEIVQQKADNFLPSLPVVLSERILDRNNWVLLGELLVQISQFYR